ncbi:hypothetical protein COW99_03230 [Candidatus Roizmanbacteria bacterium CG22_combo_CG10-13_8_21_14_all_38_20]|uniref:Uncharacterized protein n=1 Tax=Candidatus Roizmanbacteria bacterium CG22_combo_CG10-13_8_21_14_all_38_20 TaxID=1974862 RepID=A0A2H0BX66_9BACT|nr:MAG: hypothetical protein COW99_03230 [Candidatus Roizmanbacteria bacterium CG22_combo_CG10-13_8_21_14_all_38_20]PJC31553.1 MAG: hypothetical protein CO050_03170 [Candidatus Roizmanbacteria bacterium CG_4_9_14_0_2_um_filter_38_17]
MCCENLAGALQDYGLELQANNNIEGALDAWELKMQLQATCLVANGSSNHGHADSVLGGRQIASPRERWEDKVQTSQNMLGISI